MAKKRLKSRKPSHALPLPSYLKDDVPTIHRNKTTTRVKVSASILPPNCIGYGQVGYVWLTIPAIKDEDKLWVAYLILAQRSLRFY